MKTVETKYYHAKRRETVIRLEQTRIRETSLAAIKERKVVLIGKDWIKAPNWTAMEFVLK